MEMKGKFVKVRFKKYFPEQRLWVLLGKVLEMTEQWVTIEGKGIISHRGQTEVDKEPRVMLVPRDNIAHIRVLPDTFDLAKIKIIIRAGRDFVKVENGPDTSIGEEI